MHDEAPRGLAGVAAADPARVALVMDGRRTTFGELDTAANAVAHALAPHVGAPGARVAVMLSNSEAGFALWHGVTRLGALVVPVSTRLTAAEVAYLVEDSGAVLVVHDDDAPHAAAARAAAARAAVPAMTPGEALAGGPRPAPPSEDYLGTPVVAMTYTSGTTGRPKGIERAAPEPARDAPPNPFASFWGFGPDDVHLMAGPMYHTAPSAYALMSLGEGGRVVIMGRWDATECLRLIEAEGVSTAQMVPANFIRILEADWAAYDRSSVRKVLHAAAPCPVPVKRRIMEVFPPDTVWEYYGASEGMASVISPAEWLAKPGSVGRPFPGVTVRILDEQGVALAPGEVGTVYVSAFAGRGFRYHNAPDKTDAAWRDDSFTVGDMGWLDEDGYLFLADRRTDLIISGGVNIYPAEVETALVEEDDVVDAAVIGLPDERMGQRVHAVVELRPGSGLDAEELRARLASRLADFKLPRTFEFVAELPREPNGKVLKRTLREERMAPPSAEGGGEPALAGGGEATP
ncbi:MAG TPA: AMP-binding protein [Acidimicrobiales bacterium]|nr:AMP-binding protein [Acidimicrobiales bacterium]